MVKVTGALAMSDTARSAPRVLRAVGLRRWARWCGLALTHDATCIALLVTACLAVYMRSLDAEFAYDDKVSVVGNPDVTRPDVPMSDILTHDFWGNDLLMRTRAYGWTHYSWRPLVVATLRADWWRSVWVKRLVMGLTEGLAHGMRAAAGTVGGSELELVNTTRSLPDAHASAGPGVSPSVCAHVCDTPPGHPRPFHESNLIIHAVSCVIAYCAFRCLVPRGHDHPASHTAARSRSLPLLAGLLFALHPIKSECVANVTSRADALASVFQLGALAVYVRVFVRGDAGGILSADHTATRQQCSSTEPYATLLRWLAAAIIAVLGLLAMACKETTLMLPLLCAAADIAATIVAAVQRMGSRLAKPSAARDLHMASSSQPPTLASVNGSMESTLSWAVHFIYSVALSAPWSRLLCLLCVTGAAYYVRIIVMAEGYTLQEWANPLHNPLPHINNTASRVASIAMVQSFALSSLVLPVYLSHEHNAINVVESATDVRLALVAVVCSAAIALLYAVWRWLAWLSLPGTASALSIDARTEQYSSLFRVLFAGAFVLLAYLPSSHALQYVAFVMAERTLYLPSFGAVLLMSELLTTPFMGLWAEGHAFTHASDSKAEVHGPHAGLRTSCGRRSRIPAMGLAVVLGVYYAWRTDVRNLDWRNEDTLLSSNVRLYPINNPMSTYGLGARALYRGDIQTAEHFLREATHGSTMVEPLILLSQLYWKYHQNASGIEKAREILEVIAVKSGRREVIGNLGMLMMSAGPPATATDDDAVEAYHERWESYILGAHLAHGYPSGHRNIGVLATNAGLVRMMSEPYRYGDPATAESLLLEGVRYEEMAGGNAHPFLNAALYYAVQGMGDAARACVARGLIVFEQRIAEATASMEASVASQQVSPAQQARLVSLYASKRELQQFDTIVRINQPLLTRFREQGLAVGRPAMQRMHILGLEYNFEMLWW